MSEIDANRQAYLKKRENNRRSKSGTKKIQLKWRREDDKRRAKMTRSGNWKR